MYILIIMNQYIVYVVSRCIQLYIMTTRPFLHSYVSLATCYSGVILAVFQLHKYNAKARYISI